MTSLICNEELRHVALNATGQIKHHLNEIERVVKACADEGLSMIENASTKDKIAFFASLFGIDPKWALAIAAVESAVGKYQKSPTGARGVFQMTTIAMKDLLLEMEKHDDDLVDIVCGIAFLRLLLRRHGSVEKATAKYCDPNDREVYVAKVLKLMEDSDK